MILTADSTAARAANRRKTGNGWHTTFIGRNRNTLREGEAAPDSGTLYPMAFLVEKEAGAVVRPHFHQASDDAILLRVTDAPVMQRLGFHRVEPQAS